MPKPELGTFCIKIFCSLLKQKGNRMHWERNHELEIANFQIRSAQTSSRKQELYVNHMQMKRQKKEIWPLSESENSQYRIS